MRTKLAFIKKSLRLPDRIRVVNITHRMSLRKEQLLEALKASAREWIQTPTAIAEGAHLTSRPGVEYLIFHPPNSEIDRILENHGIYDLEILYSTTESTAHVTPAEPHGKEGLDSVVSGDDHVYTGAVSARPHHDIAEYYLSTKMWIDRLYRAQMDLINYQLEQKDFSTGNPRVDVMRDKIARLERAVETAFRNTR